MTFHLPDPLPPDVGPLLPLACLGGGGFDPTPMPTRVRVQPGRLTASRGPTDSGFLQVPWPVGAAGVRMVATATLRERAEPYHLLLELARGKLNQVRSQVAEWREIGLETPAEFDRDLEDATRLFGVAVHDRGSAAAEAAATGVIDRAFRLADRVVQLYTEQMFATRTQNGGKLGTLLTARYATAPAGPALDEYRATFTAARVGVRWRDVEPAESRYSWAAVDAAVDAARATGRPVVFGPVLDLAPGVVPDFAVGWHGDLPTIAAFMGDYLETVIGRYKGHVRRWVVCGGFNHADGLGLRDDDRLRLAARLVEAALDLDPDLDLSVSIAQPWGDYLAGEDQSIPPGVFAEDLIRTGLKLSAVELEIRTGSRPRASWPRDALDAARLLDHYAQLGLPLEVLISHPAGPAADPLAVHGEAAWPPDPHGGPTPADQADWGAALAGLALCKPTVRAVTWDHWSDADPHLTPAGGLVDAAGRAHPLLARLRGLRDRYLA